MIGSWTIGATNQLLGTYGESCSFNGDDTPYHLRKKGLWPVNKFEKSKSYFRQDRVNLVDRNGKPLSPARYNTPRSVVTVSSVSQTAVVPSDVLSDLASEWRNTDLNIGMYFSPEGRESLEMIGDGLKRVANSAIALKRGNFGGFVRNLNSLPRSARRSSARKFEEGDLSGAFLSAHLGWEPLIKDIWNASENLAPLVSGNRRITAQKKKPAATFTAKENSSYFKADFRVLTNKQQLRYTLDTSVAPTWTERFGLDNPFLIAWELVPLSFVADYFLPIGSTIDALAFLAKVKGKGWTKEYREAKFSLMVPKGSCINGMYGYFAPSDMRGLYGSSYFKRTPWVPSLTDPLRSLSCKLPTSVMKLSTLAALTHQRLLSLDKRR